MTSYADQINAAQAAHRAVLAVESNAVQQIRTAFSNWDAGLLTKQTIRHQLERIVRSAYRSSASIASTASQGQSGIEGWKPTEVFNTEYLQSLLKDVRKNLRAYKATDDPDQKRKFTMWIEFSAQVAAQAGATDQGIQAYTELEDFGYRIVKAWAANFLDHVPCPVCASLHGTVIGLHEEFPHPEGSGRVYYTLQGPPRHPRCQCHLVFLIQTLDNAFEKLDFSHPELGRTSISTDDVKKLPSVVLASVLAVLKAIIARFRKKK